MWVEAEELAEMAALKDYSAVAMAVSDTRRACGRTGAANGAARAVGEWLR
jgi:hypothetical protein